MTSDVGAHALDATVHAVANPPDPARILRRLKNDVDTCRRVRRSVADAVERVEAKYAKLEALLAGKSAELAEAEAMIGHAEAALVHAEAALAEVEG